MASNTIKRSTTTPAVDTIIITKTNTNPSSMYGGTWELIDKKFKTAEYNTGFTINSTNASSYDSFVVIPEGHHISIRVYVTLKVALSTSSLVLGTFDATKFGGNSKISIQQVYFLGDCDGGNGVAIMTAVATGSTSSDTTNLTAYKAICKGKDTSTTIASGNKIKCFFEVPFTTSQMNDAFCDRFYWKRTA